MDIDKAAEIVIDAKYSAENTAQRKYHSNDKLC